MPAKPPASSVPPIEPTPAGPPRVPVVPQAPPAPPAAPAYYAPTHYAQPTAAPSGLAIASLVTGIVGAFFGFLYGIGFLSALAAVITGHIAQRRKYGPRGFWIAGLVCGYVGLALSLIWLIALIGLIIFAVTNPSDPIAG